MNLSQKVAFNTTVQIVSKIITVSFTILTTILLTSYLGKESFGDYMYVITLAIIFGALADWGTVTIGVREMAKEKEKQGQLLANILILRLFLSFLAIAVLLFVSFFLPLQAQDPLLVRRIIRVFSPIIFLIAIKASFGIIFQSRLEMGKTAAADIATSFLIFLFSFYAVKKGFGLEPLIWAMIWASFAGMLVAAFFAIKTTKIVFQIDKKIIADIIRESLPMGAILLMFTMDNKIDTVMLGAFKGSGAVGIYGISWRIYDVLILGAAYFMNALLPVISQYSPPRCLSSISPRRSRGRCLATSEASAVSSAESVAAAVKRGWDVRRPGWTPRRCNFVKLQEIYQKGFDILFLLGIVGVIFVWLFAPLMVRFLTQQRFTEFSDSAAVLRILVVAMFVAYFNHLSGYTIVALGKQRPYFFIALGSLVFNIAANLVIIPRFSYFGAAWVTVLTEGLVLSITTIFIFRLLGVVPSMVNFPKTAVQLLRKKGKIF